MTSPLPAIAILGITDAGTASLLPGLAEIVACADVLVGGERHLAFFPGHPARRIVIRSDMAALAQTLRAEHAAGHKIVVLASGDPLLYGIGSMLRRFFPADALRIHPNVSAVQLAWARIAEPWHDAGIVSAHGRALTPVIDAARRYAGLAILTDGDNTPAVIATALLAAGLRNRPVAVCERLGGVDEQVIRTTIAALPGQTFDPLNILLLLPADGATIPVITPGGWLPGAPDDAFGQRVPERGLITKREVRVLSLAALGLRAGDILWDVGAGSGSVAIEAAHLVPSARVYAIERDPASLPLIQKNCQRFQTENVTLIAGNAPEICVELPDPDAVFVGGSGGLLSAIIATAMARLRIGGRLVVNLATLEGLHEAIAAIRTHGESPEVIQVSIGRGKAIGANTRLQALNPVFIVSTERSAE
ncbi:MAG: precorrin-6y C5,15-methyltransferase (decarboxylating) subunit CbiE [Thermomicrobia bacterium]|nr:precorrin-6y C5,15-methyltransferase (decarboxylating) subunit CbiE [Thermomicrobia bacterium]